MLDLGYVREHLDVVEKRLRDRGPEAARVLEGFQQLDSERRALITESETLKAKQNHAIVRPAGREQASQT